LVPSIAGSSMNAGITPTNAFLKTNFDDGAERLRDLVGTRIWRARSPWRRSVRPWAERSVRPVRTARLASR
jgi:hypothetical protein